MAALQTSINASKPLNFEGTRKDACHYDGVFRVAILTGLLACVPSLGMAQSQQSAAFQGFDLSPPCQGVPRPDYAAPGSPPRIGVWTEADVNKAAWRAAPCLQWTGIGTRMAAALSASLHAPSLDDLLVRYGAASQYKSIRFWSTVTHRWENFVSTAGFTDGPEANYTHPDLTADDFQAGREFYYYEIDVTGRRIHRLTVRRRTADSVELATENLTAIRYSVFTIFEPGALQTATFIERRGADEWGFYQTIGVGSKSDFLAVHSASPYVNRLTAFYRYMAGIPTDSQPPVAPN
jgi:hypothetical protein